MFIWTIWDALAVIVLLGFCFASLFFWWPIAMRRWQCSHDGEVRETMACDAICCKCGENLGFIGAWREKVAASTRKGQT